MEDDREINDETETDPWPPFSIVDLGRINQAAPRNGYGQWLRDQGLMQGFTGTDHYRVRPVIRRHPTPTIAAALAAALSAKDAVTDELFRQAEERRQVRQAILMSQLRALIELTHQRYASYQESGECVMVLIVITSREGIPTVSVSYLSTDDTQYASSTGSDEEHQPLSQFPGPRTEHHRLRQFLDADDIEDLIPEDVQRLSQWLRAQRNGIVPQSPDISSPRLSPFFAWFARAMQEINHRRQRPTRGNTTKQNDPETT